MYRTTNDPRFRRRLNEIGQTLENANESAQSGIYIFSQTYIKPCFDSIGESLTTCVDAGCPSLNLRNRDRLRRQRGRGRSQGRAESSFDFYDDWDEDENDGLLGWGTDEFDSLVATNAGYGTIASAQPGRQRGMSYPKPRQKGLQDINGDPAVISGPNFFGRLFGRAGGKQVKYKPSAAGLQDHPGANKGWVARRDMTEGEALLDEGGATAGVGTWASNSRARKRSDTAVSGETHTSLSSRGDIFPSDDEDDAVPLDDEFAMVLERRTTNSGNVSGPETEGNSDKASHSRGVRRGKRPSATSRGSSRRTTSSRSVNSRGSIQNSRASSYAALPTRVSSTSEVNALAEDQQYTTPTVSSSQDLRQEDARIVEEFEAEAVGKSRGLEDLASHNTDFAYADRHTPMSPQPAQLPTPLATDDEDEGDDNRDAPSSASIPRNDTSVEFNEHI